MGIFDQIKSAFGKDVPEPAKAKEPPAPPAETAPEPVAAEAAANSYTVQSGDTLWKIAAETLGDGERYTEIFEANRDILDAPEHILPGQELKLP